MGCTVTMLYSFTLLVLRNARATHVHMHNVHALYSHVTYIYMYLIAENIHVGRDYM